MFVVETNEYKLTLNQLHFGLWKKKETLVLWNNVRNKSALCLPVLFLYIFVSTCVNNWITIVKI